LTPEQEVVAVYIGEWVALAVALLVLFGVCEAWFARRGDK
jgi:hypothetical protein